jgi:hypothetical protein
MASSEYPLQYRILISGRRPLHLSASSLPLISGRTTSVDQQMHRFAVFFENPERFRSPGSARSVPGSARLERLVQPSSDQI